MLLGALCSRLSPVRNVTHLTVAYLAASRPNQVLAQIQWNSVLRAPGWSANSDSRSYREASRYGCHYVGYQVRSRRFIGDFCSGRFIGDFCSRRFIGNLCRRHFIGYLSSRHFIGYLNSRHFTGYLYSETSDEMASKTKVALKEGWFPSCKPGRWQLLTSLEHNLSIRQAEVPQLTPG